MKVIEETTTSRQEKSSFCNLNNLNNMPSRNKKRHSVRLFDHETQVYLEDRIWYLIQDYCKLNNIATSDFFRCLLINNFAKEYINKFMKNGNIK